LQGATPLDSRLEKRGRGIVRSVKGGQMEMCQ